MWEASILRARRALRDGELARAEELALGLTAMHYSTELCCGLGDARRAARPYDLLQPYGERVVVIPIVAFLGSVSRLLEETETANHRRDGNQILT